jgi:ribonuclease HI
MMMNECTIHIDGATAGKLHAGAAAVARSVDGDFLGWTSRQLPRMTNNEAEYHALLLGLELAQQLQLQQVRILSDSEVVVRQMAGRSRVLSARLRLLHRDACLAVRYFEHVHLAHVPREENRLADALAGEAISGATVQSSALKSHKPITMPTQLSQISLGIPTTARDAWERVGKALMRRNDHSPAP